jgi:hypothetical protein
MHEKGESHALAVERFEAARTERDQRSDEHDAATGSPRELTTFTELQAAEDQFAAREAWLLWVDRDY